MDISDFLASMQTDPQSKMLAKNTDVHMGIPEPDGSAAEPAAPEQDDMSMPVGGADVSGFDGTDDMAYAEGGPIPGVQHVHKRATKQYTSQPVQAYAEGGEVEEDAPMEQGALPDPSMGQEVTAPVTNEEPPGRAQDDDNSWRTPAMEAIEDAFDHGYARHAVNRPVSDDTHESDVRQMMEGHGSTPPDQIQAGLQAVDPEGTMDESSRLQKLIGTMAQFYGRGSGRGTAGGTGSTESLTEGQQAGGGVRGARAAQDNSLDQMGQAGSMKEAPAGNTGAGEAVWGVLQYARRAFNAFAGHASVAIDNGAMPAAASSLQAALNKVPDGLLVSATWQGSPAAAAEGGQGPAIPQDVLSGRFAVNIRDPETGKVVADVSLSPEQAKHIMATPFDRLARVGVVNNVGAASEISGGSNLRTLSSARNRAQGQWWDGGQRDPTQSAGAEDQYVAPRVRFPQSRANASGSENPNGQDHITIVRGGQSQDVPYGVQHGLPPEVDTRGMSVGQIARLRDQYQHGQVQNLAGRGGERERVAEIAARGALARTQEQQRGLNGRVLNAPGQQAHNERTLLTQTNAAVKAWVAQQRTPPTPEQQQQQFDTYMQFFRSRMQTPGGQQQQQPAPQAPQQQPQPQRQGAAPSNPQAATRENPIYSGGRPYYYDAARQKMMPVGQ